MKRFNVTSVQSIRSYQVVRALKQQAYYERTIASKRDSSVIRIKIRRDVCEARFSYSLNMTSNDRVVFHKSESKMNTIEEIKRAIGLDIRELNHCKLEH